VTASATSKAGRHNSAREIKPGSGNEMTMVITDARSSIAQLRTIVAALGERTAPPWWRTTLLTDVGLRIGARVFPRTAASSALKSVFHAAQIDHDQRIGSNRYHLFRLPPDLERDLISERFTAKHAIEDLLRTDVDGLLTLLQSIADGKKPGREGGPVRIGSLDEVRDRSWVPMCAAEYLSAITTGVRRFPYFESSERHR
jgi:hypothetical protein